MSRYLDRGRRRGLVNVGGMHFPPAYLADPPDEPFDDRPAPRIPVVVPASAYWPHTVPCACGEGAFYWDDGDGWLREPRVIDADRVDVDCSGVVEECRACGRELVAGPRDKQKREEG